MNKIFFTKRTSILLLAISLFSSCMEKDVYQGDKNTPLNPTEVFDFSLTKEVKLNVDYGFTNDYYIIFELYNQNPMKEENNSWIKDEKLSPIYAASTDKKGQYSGQITIPSDITEIWIYSDYPGAVSPVKLAVSNEEINFDQAEYIASLQTNTRATTAGGYSYPDDWKLIPGTDWDVYGLPVNIESILSMPPAEILYSIKKTYTKVAKEGIKVMHPEWLNNNTTSEIKTTKATEVSLVFISSGAGWNNTIGYFTYPTNEVPTESTVQKILAFPNASPISKSSGTGRLLCGHEMKLKYWNESTQQFEDKFPAGVTLGWCLEGMGFNNGNIKKTGHTRFSYSSMNSDNAQRVVALRDGGTNQIVAIGFEDNTDYDYCDATFYVKIAEANAIDPEGPELPPVDPPSNLEYTVYGTLTYEDQWPSEGDYDMNDVVVEYQSTIYKSALDDKIYKIMDEFTPIHNGGSYVCGFGYQLSNIDPSKVRSINVTGSDSWEMETGQSHPTITLFNDIKKVLGQKITVTTEVIDISSKDNSVNPPYNPFIFVNDRNREVHLVNYPPTNKADMELFNTQDDVSNTSAGIYYIARYKEEIQLMPFGINLPNIVDFNIPAEGVKIYNTYPDFIEWVKSDGSTHKNWYKK